jgi:hypothetical protein
MLLYFLRGSLPWQGLQAATRGQRYQAVLEKKQSIKVAELCAGLPAEFSTYVNYVRQLHFEDKPNYSFLQKIFRGLFIREGFKHDNVFDWTILEFQRTTALGTDVGSTRSADRKE